jgi:TrmH family RNA methyltransferase
VQDPGNVGTLLRIADWFALDRVVLSPDCADLFSQKVINASMGSFARVRVHTADLATALAGLPATTPVLGCDLDRHGRAHAPRRCATRSSSSAAKAAACRPPSKAGITEFITIPRLGGAESLNAGIAAAIVCDNLRRLAP